MSVTDQYLFRAGLSRHIPHVDGLAASFGGRMEGIPVRDAFGKSDGFRRSGYIISVEPAVQYQYRRSMFSLSAPWAVQRNRRASVNDLAKAQHGDAASPTTPSSSAWHTPFSQRPLAFASAFLPL